MRAIVVSLPLSRLLCVSVFADGYGLPLGPRQIWNSEIFYNDIRHHVDLVGSRLRTAIRETPLRVSRVPLGYGRMGIRRGGMDQGLPR